MRCICCNTALNDYESTVRHGITRQFLEMCSICLKSVDAYIPIQVRNDLLSENDTANGELIEDDDSYIEDYEDDVIDDYWKER
jgi:hypothetical protein